MESHDVFALLSGLVGVIGLLAAIIAWFGIAAEKKILEETASRLVSPESWSGCKPASEKELATWLQGKKIERNSHVGDAFVNAWSAWTAARPAVLAEFHALAGQRERARGSARLAAGIAALLLVFGIIGTLCSVKPILNNFKIGTSAEGEVEEATQSAGRINNLVNDLGDAFLPSLLALGFTILVVGARGGYVMKAHYLSLDLDRFVIGTLLPRYKITTITDDLGDVRDGLASLTRQLLDRDNKFGDAVAKLEKVVIGIQPVIETLRQAAHHSETAADRLAERSQSIADSLQNTIGTKSPAYKAISSFGSVFERSEEAIQKLTGLVERVGKSLHHLPEDLQASSQASLAGALDQLGRIIKDKEDGARKFRDPANTPYQEHSSPAGAAFAQRDGKAPGNPNRTPAATHGGTDLAAAIQAFSGQHKQDPAAPAKSRDALLAEALARAGSANAATPELTEYSPLDPPRGYDRSSG